MKQVGFTSMRDGNIERFSLKNKNQLLSIPEPETDGKKEPIEIIGHLRYVNVIKGRHEIRLVDEAGKS